MSHAMIKNVTRCFFRSPSSSVGGRHLPRSLREKLHTGKGKAQMNHSVVFWLKFNDTLDRGDNTQRHDDAVWEDAAPSSCSRTTACKYSPPETIPG